MLVKNQRDVLRGARRDGIGSRVSVRSEATNSKNLTPAVGEFIGADVKQPCTTVRMEVDLNETPSIDELEFEVSARNIGNPERRKTIGTLWHQSA
jgi:hypothetical protein